VEQIKAIGLWIGNFLGVGFTGYGFFETIDTVKEAVIFILGVTWGVLRIYFYYHKQRVEKRQRDLEQRQREETYIRINKN